MRWPFALAALAVLASCPRADRGVSDVRAPDLETAAVLRGLVRDPSDVDVVGLYARDTDRVCIVRQGSAYRIGAYVDYGDGIGCSGAGTATRSGDRLRVTLGQGCAFDARFDGDRIAFPVGLPTACETLCGRRASFAALEAIRLSESAAEAATMRDAVGRLPCAG
ncbi:MAG: hypothetical protein V4537_06005 [Pseudomonadota bacterium]